jgi:hypothetical protein
MDKISNLKNTEIKTSEISNNNIVNINKMKLSNLKTLRDKNIINNKMDTPIDNFYQVKLPINEKYPPKYVKYNDSKNKTEDKYKNKGDNYNNSPIRYENFFQNLITGNNTNNNVGIITGKINNIFVLDLDFYNKSDYTFDKNTHKFVQDLGYPSEDNNYLYDTFTCKTPKGGYHLYFKFNELIRQTQNKEHQIDIRSNSGYVVAPFSKINGNEYTILNNTDIKEAPVELINWILNNLYTENQKKQMKEKVKKSKNNKNKKIKINEDKIVNELIYKYHLSDKEINKVLDGLEDKWFNTLDDWAFLKYTSFMKLINRKDKWLEYNEKKCCDNEYENKWKYKNECIWNGDLITEFDSYEMIFDKEVDKWVYKLDKNDEKIPCKVDIVSYFFKISNSKLHINYCKYQPLPHEINRTIDKQFTAKKLGHILSHDDMKKGSKIIKSRMTTGKSTLTKNTFDKTGEKFISITSRRTLADEHYYNLFRYFGDTYHYEKNLNTFDYKWENNTEYFEGNLIIQVDSIHKDYMDDLNIEEYTIFLDEFNSIIHHIVNSPHIKQKGIDIMTSFIYLLKNCKRVICCDAHISDICFEVLDYCGIKYEYYQNDYVHYDKKQAYELYSTKIFVNKLAKEEEFMVCCDSEKNAIALTIKTYKKLGYKVDELLEEYKDLDEDIEDEIDLFINKLDNVITNKDHKIKIITDRTTKLNEVFNLDKESRVIISPKIIYGLDCTAFQRNVYCYYKEHTINCLSMIQQLGRNRNINNLYFMFLKKKYTPARFQNYKECEDYIKQKERFVINQIIKHEHLCKLYDDGEYIQPYTQSDISASNFYIRLLTNFTYKDSCMNTNKRVHFIKMLEDEGFIVHTEHRHNTDDKNEDEMTDKEILDSYISASFDIKDEKVLEFNDKFFELSKEDIIKYKRIFIDKQYATNHFNIRKYYITGQNCRDYDLYDNFMVDLVQKDSMINVDKADDTNLQFHFLNMLLMETRFKTDEKEKKFKQKKVEYRGHKISLRKKLSEDRINNFYKKYYPYIHNDRKNKDICWKLDEDILKLIKVLHSKLFGKELIIGKQCRVKGTQSYTTEYYFNQEYLQEQITIYQIGKGQKESEDYSNSGYMIIEE